MRLLRTLWLGQNLLEVEYDRRVLHPGGRDEPADIDTTIRGFFINGRPADADQHAALVDRVLEKGR
jgi:hypothetical protein